MFHLVVKVAHILFHFRKVVIANKQDNIAKSICI